MKPRIFSTARLSFPFTAAFAALLGTPSASAATLYWSGNGSTQGGSGIWDNGTTARWGTVQTGLTPGTYASTWNNSNNDTADFNNAASTPTLGSDITVGGINAKVGGSTGTVISAGSGPFKITLGLTTTTFSNAASTTAGRNLAVNAEITGSNNLSIVGPSAAIAPSGTTTLGAINTFTGTLAVSRTTLAIGASGQLNSGNYANTISIGTNGAFAYRSSLNQTLGGNITGSGILSKSSSAASSLVLSGANSYSGGTNVDAGTLTFRNTGARPATGPVTVAAGATLGLGVATSGSFFTSANVDSLFAGTLSGVTNDPTSNVGIDTSQEDFTYATSVGGAPTRGLVKLGANSLILTGTNTYTGATQVNSGKLVVEGSIAPSAVTVSGTGTILATDTAAAVGNSLLIQSGAILAVGDAGNAATATATVTNATTFNNDSIFSWDINAVGTSYDKLVTTDVLGEGAAGDAIFRIVAADAAFENTFWDIDRTWTDIFTTDGSSAISGWASVFGNTVSVVNSGFTPITPEGGSFSVSGNTLTWTAVPEPTSALAGVLLSTGLLRRRRQS
jgi:autotransporter-associated beta strand protein